MMKKLFAFLLFLSVSLPAIAADLPQILNESDVATYSEIFNLQADEKIDAAKKLDAQIQDQILMQEVLFQRYISKTYRTRGAEVADWMKKYYDQPGADRMFKLSKIKKVSTRTPKLPSVAFGSPDSAAKSESWTAKNYGGNAGKQIKKFKNSLTGGNTKNARHILENKTFEKSISRSDFGRLAGRLAFVYYTNGEFELAGKFGEKSSLLQSEYGLWTMGLLAFKNGQFEESLSYFEDLSELTQINDARKIEALFWAGRSAEMADNSDTAKTYWKLAAEKPQLFYGALSAAMLGQTPKYKFFDKEISDEDLEELVNTGYGRTALALLQIGNKTGAEKYLRLLLTNNASDRQLHAVYSLASSEELPRVSMQAAGLVRDRGLMEIDRDVIFSAQYPLPDWEPLGGWSIDRALLFAITRQESGFKASAESNKGAKGLMQVMPKTAKLVAKRNNVRMSELDISKPEHNMFLGQQYIVDLLNLPNVDNNIIKMLASYNSGNGAMSKFEKNFETTDPLLYIESFPNVETRNYIKRVVSNLWLYRARLDQPLTSLEDLANGKWPLYSLEDEYVQSQIKSRTI